MENTYRKWSDYQKNRRRQNMRRFSQLRRPTNGTGRNNFSLYQIVFNYTIPTFPRTVTTFWAFWRSFGTSSSSSSSFLFDRANKRIFARSKNAFLFFSARSPPPLSSSSHPHARRDVLKTRVGKTTFPECFCCGRVAVGRGGGGVVEVLGWTRTGG